MTARKPPGVSWENWAERQIREGIERGEFDQLPGAGKPIPGLDAPHDELWWVKEKLRREDVTSLPPTLAVRKELEDALAEIAAAASEETVRSIAETINHRIRHVNRYAASGPPSSVMPLDIERVLERWRERRG